MGDKSLKKSKKSKKSKRKAEEVSAAKPAATLEKRQKIEQSIAAMKEEQGKIKKEKKAKKKKKKKAKGEEQDFEVVPEQAPQEDYMEADEDFFDKLATKKKKKKNKNKNKIESDSFVPKTYDEEEGDEAWPAAKASDNSSEASAAKATFLNSGAAAMERDNKDNTRVFCGNLSFKITDEILQETFGHCGEVHNIHWVTDKQTGQFYGTAFVDFTTHEAAVEALKLNGTDVLKRKMKVNWAMGGNRTANNRANKKTTASKRVQTAPLSKKPNDCRTVFLGNLHFEITEAEVREVFEGFGEIKDIRWVEKDDQFKGCGFIEFWETGAVDGAVKLNGTDLRGRPVRVDYAANQSDGNTFKEKI